VATPLSPLDRPLTLTRFNSKVASKKREVKTTLRELESKIKSIVKPDKDSLPWLKLASFGDERTDKNSFRHDANVLQVHGIECDYDAGAMTIGQAVKLLKQANVAALLYESASSTLFEPRFRIICPFSTTLAPQERKQLVARVNGVLGGTLDGASFNLSQAFLFGGIEGQPSPRTELVDGRYIDQAHDLDAGAIGRRAKADSDGEMVAASDNTGSGAAFRKAMALQLAGETVEAFEEWASENPWKDYEANSERAIERTWERAGREAGAIAIEKLQNTEPVEFDDLGPETDVKPKHGLNVTCFADLEPENIEWTWRSRLARGKISILAGDPGQGKSQISSNLAAAISTGGNWPDGGKASMGSVVILSAEDGAADTTLPRLMAAGADCKKVHSVRSVTDKGKDRSFNLGADIKQLGELCDQLGDVVLVIVDPITSYLGEIDSHRTSDVRAVLEPFGNWAEKARIAVLAISHPPKAAQGKAINSFTGSLAFIAAARIGMIAVTDPENSERSLLLSVKSNIDKKAAGLGYRIEGRTVDGPKGPIITSGIAWDDKEVTITADQALAATRGTDKPAEAMGDALAFLRDRLGFGASLPANEMTEAKANCISDATLRRARKQLGVVAEKGGYQGAWVWRIPDALEDVV
jgi:putative DNA primase/helicase